MDERAAFFGMCMRDLELAAEWRRAEVKSLTKREADLRREIHVLEVEIAKRKERDNG